MTRPEVVAWAETHYPEVLTEEFLKNPPSGRTLSVYSMETFMQVYGKQDGIGFYLMLVREGTSFYFILGIGLNPLCPSALRFFLFRPCCHELLRLFLSWVLRDFFRSLFLSACVSSCSLFEDLFARSCSWFPGRVLLFVRLFVTNLSSRLFRSPFGSAAPVLLCCLPFAIWASLRRRLLLAFSGVLVLARRSCCHLSSRFFFSSRLQAVLAVCTSLCLRGARCFELRPFGVRCEEKCRLLLNRVSWSIHLPSHGFGIVRLLRPALCVLFWCRCIVSVRPLTRPQAW